jgi:hypothetical protein
MDSADTGKPYSSSLLLLEHASKWEIPASAKWFPHENKRDARLQGPACLFLLDELLLYYTFS